ncbi:hypothetical protein LINPERPRIM_LOCUS22163 [Linum perenne]
MFTDPSLLSLFTSFDQFIIHVNQFPQSKSSQTAINHKPIHQLTNIQQSSNSIFHRTINCRTVFPFYSLSISCKALHFSRSEL